MNPAPLRRAAGALLALSVTATACAHHDERPVRYPPVVVMSLYTVPGVVVRGATRQWWKLASQPLGYGDPVPVGITMYCLSGTTRRGRYVRDGIVAADPEYFPLSRYIELYVGGAYLGRFLVDDTGKKIRGARIDVWTSNCHEARRFGVARGTAVLVRRPTMLVEQAGKPQGRK